MTATPGRPAPLPCPRAGDRQRALRLRPTPVVVAGRPGTTCLCATGIEVRWDLALAPAGSPSRGLLPVCWTDVGLRWHAFALGQERPDGITLGALVGIRAVGAPVRQPWRTLRLSSRDGRPASAVYGIAHADDTWLEVDVDPEDDIRPDVVWTGEVLAAGVAAPFVARSGRRGALLERAPRTRLQLRWWPSAKNASPVFGGIAAEGGLPPWGGGL